jgi:hypothetical protein
LEPRGKKILYGCGIGCLVVMVLGIGSCVGFVIWVNQPGELLEPDLLVGSDTTGYVAWTLRLEDPGTDRFVHSLLESVERVSDRSSGGIHPALDTWLSNMQKRRNRRKIQDMFPLVVAWTAHPGETAGADFHLVSASFEQAGNQMVLMDWILGLTLGWADGVSVVSHRREKIFGPPAGDDENFAFFIRGNDLFFASDLGTAKQAVDRLLESRVPDESFNDVQRLLADLPAESPLRGAISNRGGELARVWNALAGGSEGASSLPAGIVGATITGGLADEETLQATLSFRCAGARQATENADGLTGLMRSALEPLDVPVEMETSTAGDLVRIDVRLGEITSSLERFLMKHAGRRRG